MNIYDVKEIKTKLVNEFGYSSVIAKMMEYFNSLTLEKQLEPVAEVKTAEETFTIEQIEIAFLAGYWHGVGNECNDLSSRKKAFRDLITKQFKK